MRGHRALVAVVQALRPVWDAAFAYAWLLMSVAECERQEQLTIGIISYIRAAVKRRCRHELLSHAASERRSGRSGTRAQALNTAQLTFSYGLRLKGSAGIPDGWG